ncbi:MAG: hypothetical protein IPG50_07635 [Myxococcales bacterium]|nr:hypothetical protein [Myxococcales bacterium]
MKGGPWESTLMGVVELVARAGAVVRDRYARRDLAVEYKGPNDPVTEADRAANELLCEGLAKLLPGAQVIAEETASEVDDPSRADLTFFVDPLDGTRDFVERTGEFSVMVGLVEGEKGGPRRGGRPHPGAHLCCGGGRPARSSCRSSLGAHAGPSM